MTISIVYVYTAIALIAALTYLTRAAPFASSTWLRQGGAAERLGRDLPPGILVVLVIYCMKDVRATSPPYAVPELASLVICGGLHVWRRNVLISIAAGTICFILLSRWLS